MPKTPIILPDDFFSNLTIENPLFSQESGIFIIKYENFVKTIRHKDIIGYSLIQIVIFLCFIS